MHEFRPRMLGFLCNWCCYAGADLCGVSRYQYPPNLRVIRVMCSGRVDTEHVIRSFLTGMDGVFIGGCWLGECHYITEGNYDALSMMHLTRKVLEQIGVNPERLRLEWVSASEGIRFAEVVTDFTNRLKSMGPIGQGEGMTEGELKLRLEAVQRLIPYLKLVERERIRVRFETNREYDDFFNSPETERLIRETVSEKLALYQIRTLLEREPLSSKEISESLRLDHSGVARHLQTSMKHGLVQYDRSRNRYTAASV